MQDRLGRKLLDSLYRIDRLRTELGVAIIPDCDCLRRALLARQIQFFSHEKVREHNLACPHRFAAVGTQHPGSAIRKCIMKLEQDGWGFVRSIHSHRRLRAEEPAVAGQHFQCICSLVQKRCYVIALVIQTMVVRCKLRRQLPFVRSLPVHRHTITAVSRCVQARLANLLRQYKAAAENNSGVLHAIGEKRDVLPRDRAFDPLCLPILCT